MKKMFMVFTFLMAVCVSIFGIDENVKVNSMNIITIILILVTIVVFIIFQNKKTDKTGIDIIKVELDKQKEENNKLIGQYQESLKQLNKTETQLQERNNRISELEKELNKISITKQQEQENLHDRIKDLENARTNLEDERKRVIAEEELKRKEIEEKRNKIWNLHEESSIAFMREICRKSDISLPTYDNKNLPESFDKSFKPDFLVKVLNQYVIFDTKSSTSKNINTYLQMQVKSTAKKIKDSSSCDDIYKTVYLVIPSIGLDEIKDTYFFEQGISFLIIPIEAFEPIIRILRRLEDYDLADKYDPQERENIINFIALLNHYIKEQNANNILSTIKGLQVLSESENIPNDVLEEIKNKVANIRISQPSKIQIKKFMDNPDLEIEEIKKLIQPQEPKISQEDILSIEEE